MEARAKRLLFVVNNPAFFLSHRAALAEAALAAGYEVHAATMDGPSVPRIQAMGVAHHVIPMSRSGKHPLQELKTLWALYRLFKRLRPDLVHLVTIKPVLYGGIAARMAGVPAWWRPSPAWAMSSWPRACAPVWCAPWCAVSIAWRWGMATAA